MMGNLEIFLRVCLMGFSLLLLITSIISYVKVKNTKLLFVSLAFLGFFIKGLLLTLAVLIGSFKEPFGASMAILVLDFAILIMIYIAVVKK